jgi:hypothetical protein
LAEAGAGDAAESVRFFPWIYYVPGILYAEHGNQYDDLNAFSTVLEPFDSGNPELLERSTGTYLFMGGERLLASIDPCPDHASPPMRYFKLAARRHPETVSRIVKEDIELMRGCIRHASALSGPERAKSRKAYRDKVLADYASDIGLSRDTVLRLDEESAASVLPTHALGKQVLLRTAKKLLPTRPVPTGTPATYLQKASQRIHALLERQGQAVPFYVFAHSHTAQHLPLDFGPSAPQYINAGTWSSVINPASDTLRQVRPTFVHISQPDGSGPPVARLLGWNGATASPETLRYQT